MPIYIKRSIRTFLVSTILTSGFVLLTSAMEVEDPPEGIRTVVIDAGHGGRDPGAVGKRAKEKDIALAIALKTGQYIEKNIPDVKVIYTRKKDEYVGFLDRAKVANDAEADLFISIHVNAHTVSSAKGTLTLVLGQHRMDENFDVAARENAVILLEEDWETRYEGFDPHSTESYIMFSMMQKTYFKQSIEFGDFVQDQFRERAGRKDLGVREQGLIVLAQTAMPGVLVETGFISNPEEEKYLMSTYGQEITASAIYRGFKEYKEEIDRRSNLTVMVPEESVPATDQLAATQVLIEPDQVIFSIQVASSKNKVPAEPSSFKGHQDVMIIEDGRWFKYMLGKESSYHTALERCDVIKADYPDAFVVASKNGKIIPLKDALQEINR